MNDIPRMKAAQKAAMQNMTADIWKVGCDLERELNAANQRIQQLSVLLGTEDPTTAAEILKTLIRGMDDARKLSRHVKAKQRQIKRLEKAGDRMVEHSKALGMDGTGLVSAWRKAKENKP